MSRSRSKSIFVSHAMLIDWVRLSRHDLPSRLLSQLTPGFSQVLRRK
jgi:hypothetical protein